MKIRDFDVFCKYLFATTPFHFITYQRFQNVEVTDLGQNIQEWAK